MSTTLPYQGLFPLSRLQTGVLAGAAVSALILGAWTASTLSDRADARNSTAPAEVSSAAPLIGTPTVTDTPILAITTHSGAPHSGTAPALNLPATTDALPAVALASATGPAPLAEQRIFALAPESTMLPVLRPARLADRIASVAE